MPDEKKYYHMNAAELLDSVFDVYKKSFLKQIALSFIFQIIFIAALYAVIFIGIIGILLLTMASMDFTSPKAIISIFLLIVGVLFLMMLFQSLKTTGSALITKRSFLNERTDLGQIIKATFKKMLPVSTVVVANAVVMIPVYLLLAVCIYFYVKLIIGITQYASSSSLIMLLVATLAVLALAFAVSIICSSICMMSTAVAVFEQKYFFSAVKRSLLLAKPDFAKIIGLIVVWNLITIATSYSLTSVLGIASSLSEYFLPSGAAEVVSIFSVVGSYIVSALISVLLAPLSGIFSTMMYINQRFKHQGLDIELNMNRLLHQNINNRPQM